MAKRPPTDSEAPSGFAQQRLQKVLAAAGLGSRRQCEELILEGRIEIDRQVVTELGTKVDPQSQEIRVDGEALPRPKRAYYMVHKPEGVVSTARDPSGRPRVTDLVPPTAGRLFPVGRLDMSSEGLILLTNDGELANELMHPSYGIEKTYHVQVAGEPEPDVLKQLERGVHLAEGYAHAVSARIKTRRKKSTILEIVLDEGRNREIRRLLAKVGHKVQRLTRIAIGPLRLGEMPPGAYRQLTREEVQKLRDAAALARRRRAGEVIPAPQEAPRRPADKPKAARPRKPGGKPTGKFTSKPAAKPSDKPAGRAVIGGTARTVIGVGDSGDFAPARGEDKERTSGTRPTKKAAGQRFGGDRPPKKTTKKSTGRAERPTKKTVKKKFAPGRPTKKTTKKKVAGSRPAKRTVKKQVRGKGRRR